MRLSGMAKRRVVAAIAALVAVVAVGRLWLLRLEYLDRAGEHRNRLRTIHEVPGGAEYWERRWTRMREGVGASYPWPGGPPFIPALTSYHSAMQAKWERAASRPWLPVEPDALSPRDE